MINPHVQELMDTFNDGQSNYLTGLSPEAAQLVLETKLRPQGVGLRELLQQYDLDVSNPEVLSALLVLTAVLSNWIDRHVEASGCHQAPHVAEHVNAAIAEWSYCLRLDPGE